MEWVHARSQRDQSRDCVGYLTAGADDNQPRGRLQEFTLAAYWHVLGGAVVAASIAGISLVMVTPLLGFLALPALTLASRRIDRWSQEKSQSDLSELGTTFDALVSLVEEHLEEVA